MMEPWLPAGFVLPEGATTAKPRAEGRDWQIITMRSGGLALLARQDLVRGWITSGLLAADAMPAHCFGDLVFHYICCSPDQALTPVSDAAGPCSKNQALAFATALRATRQISATANLESGLFIEALGRILPCDEVAATRTDELLLTYWLSCGKQLSTFSFADLHRALDWMDEDELHTVLAAAGYALAKISDASSTPKSANTHHAGRSLPIHPDEFLLPGRPALEEFFREHVLDLIAHRERYAQMGITFPGAIVLHGPTGCGKTHAVEALVKFLDWPSFRIDAGSVGSPYIHETSRKIAEVFNNATLNAPSVVVMDEMDAFLAVRDAASHQHQVEEVAEFLRRIPEASAQQVLLIGLTNRIESIDPAILRRGRFDHVVEVKMPDEGEVLELMQALLRSLPGGTELNLQAGARRLCNRPLSDVAFVAREAARLTVRRGQDKIDNACLEAALASLVDAQDTGRRIGFL